MADEYFYGKKIFCATNTLVISMNLVKLWLEKANNIFAGISKFQTRAIKYLYSFCRCYPYWSKR